MSEPPISSLLIDVLDAVLYLDRKQILDADGIRLFPSETHMLVLAADGMSFTEMARHFGISKGAVSQVFARLTAKGIVTVEKDRSRRNAARVSLTPLGENLYAQILAMRERLHRELNGYLAGYSAGERSVIARFVGDLRGYVRSSLSASPPAGGRQ